LIGRAFKKRNGEAVVAGFWELKATGWEVRTDLMV